MRAWWVSQSHRRQSGKTLPRLKGEAHFSGKRRRSPPPPPPPDLGNMAKIDATLGTGLIGTWLASFLFGLAVSQAFQYFNNFPKDGMLRKSLVVLSLSFSFVALVGEYADVYIPAVTSWGRQAALVTETWAVPVYSVFNSLVALTVNSYLISRFYILSKNIMITVILCGIILFVFVMAFLSVLLFPGVENFERARPLGLIWAVASAAADVCIAGALIWTLRRMSPFKNTDSIVRPIIITLVQNGCATSLMALGGMTAVVIEIFGNISSVFYFLLGPLYVLTLLSNLNLRQSGKSSGSRTLSSSRNNHNSIAPYTSIVIDGIHVGRTTIVSPTSTHEYDDIEMANRHEEESRKQDLNPESFSRAQISFRSNGSGS
ncbi:hypothetical protein C8R47DRAFT_1117968 [Mycena vitilis]|nr:hypothetical protein C8R47DRAFT_1117968 [Mycena vitilis]